MGGRKEIAGRKWFLLWPVSWTPSLLTSSLCVERIAKDESLFVIKIVSDSWRSVRDIPVDVNDRFFGLGLKKNFTTTDRKFALLRTQEPVIPDREVNENTFVKIAEDISEVNLKECSLLIGNHSDAYFEDCNVKEVDSLGNTDDLIECSIGHPDTVHDIIGLFCPLNEDVGTKVLVGLGFDSFMPISDSGVTYQVFANLVGLNITSINF